MARPALANEPDRNTRRELDAQANAVLDEEMNALHLDAAQVVQRGARDVGFANYLELYRKALPSSALDDLAEQCRTFLDSTEKLYETWADKLFRTRVGVSLGEAERWDVPRLFRAPEWDPMFPADRMVPALEKYARGSRHRPQRAEERDPRPRRAGEQEPARVLRADRGGCPDRLVLVIQPIGGPDDWRALFHEGGHTEHFAHTSRDLSMEEKRLGDNAVTEGWAMLLQHLTDEPEWLSRRLDFPRPNEYAIEGATGLLYFVRRYAAKILYELEFHAAEDVTTMRNRYVELLSDALKIEVTPANYLADIDSGFYVSSYLRSWAFEAQLRAFLKEKFGSKWFANREAGSLLRELWGEGQSMRAEEMLKEVTGSTLDMEAVAERVREVLR